MLTIGKLGEAAGVKVPTIRYYEQIGLLPEAERSSGNQRLYSRKALERKLLRGLRVCLEAPEGGELLEGKREQELGQLEGVASRPNCPLWHKGDASDQRLKVSWVVRCSPGARWGWSVCHERAGTLRGEWTCP